MELTNPLHNQRGFTMVEMLVSFLLMTVGVLASLSMITTALKSDSIANRLTAKVSLAQQVMEELLSRKSDDPVFTTAVTEQIFNLNGSGTNNDIAIQGAGTFHAVYSISPDTPPATPPATLAVTRPGSNVTRIVITITSVPADSSPFSMTCYKRTL
jgi:Tfp pilus assembly protein PilV